MTAVPAGPMLSPPSAAFAAPQPQPSWPFSTGQFSPQAPADSPLQPAFGAAQPLPAHQYVSMPPSQYLPQGQPAISAYCANFAGLGPNFNAAAHPFGFAVGQPVDQRTSRTTMPATVLQAAPGRQVAHHHPGMPPCAASDPVPAPGHPAPGREQSSRQHPPQSAAAASNAQRAVSQPVAHVELPAAAAKSVAQPAASAGKEAVRDDLEDGGGLDAARQRRSADAEAGESRSKAYTDVR